MRTELVAPRNAVLNWTRLFKVSAAAALMVARLPISRAYVGLAGLVIIGNLRELVTRELSERHGAIIYVLWLRGGATSAQPIEQLKSEVNRELRRIGERPMSTTELHQKLEWLAEFGCVTPTPVVGWRLKDSVWVTI